MIAITNEEKYLAKIAGEEITTPEPVLRKEQYLSAIANGEGTIPELPYTREEQYLAILAGENYAIPTPETRLERYMAKACGLDIDTPTPITNVEYYWAIIAEGGSWQITTLTGPLPLSFLSKGEALKNYLLHGSSEGAGVQTENLCDCTTFAAGHLDGNGNVTAASSTTYVNGLPDGSIEFTTSAWRGVHTEKFLIPAGATKIRFYYQGSIHNNEFRFTFYDSNRDFVSQSAQSGSGRFTATIPVSAVSVAISIQLSRSTTYKFTKLLLYTDLDAVTAFVPYGYQIPLTNTGENSQSSTCPLYIGSTKLGEEEYVDFGEQKVYKYSEPLKIYGWHVDPSISDPDNAITYLGDAIGMTPAAMGASTFSYGGWADAWFMPKPCMVKSDGTVDYYLDPNDYTKKADGTASDVADLTYDGNAMMEWPLIWYKYEGTSVAGEGYFYVANAKIDDSYHCWCNYDADGNIINHFYTAIYNGTGTTKLRSMSGVATTNANGCGNTSGSTEVTRATANNTTAKVEWYTDVFCDRMLINGLLILISKSLNSQAKFGNGLVTGSVTGKNGYTTGNLNDKGLFWGDTTNQTAGVKVFGMENWWGFVFHRTAGCVGLANGNYVIKQTWSTVDGSTTTGYNSSGDGYIAAGTRPSNSGQYVKQMTYANDCYFPLLASGATATTYYCDYWYTNNRSLTFLSVGGDVGSGFYAGMSYFRLNYAFGAADWNIGACLSLKPLAKQPYSPPLTPTDPPVPLPEILTYQGENTLSSTETLGEVEITGKIKEAVPNG